jgi:hypothetical protein
MGFGEVPFQGGMPFFSPGKVFGDGRPEACRVFDALPIGVLVSFEAVNLIGVRHGNTIRG